MSNYESIQSIQVSAVQRSLQYEQDNIRSCEQSIGDNEAHLEHLDDKLNRALENKEYWLSVLNDLDFPYALKDLLLGSSEKTMHYLTHFEKVYAAAIREHSLSTENYARCLTKLAEYKESKARSELKADRLSKRIPDPVYRDAVNQQLFSNEFYVRNSLRFRKAHWSDSTKITFALQETQAKVPWCYDQVKQARYTKAVIAIPSMLVDFKITSCGNVTVSLRARTGSKRYTGLSSKPLLHPHMTDPTVPCLGDFAAPIIELVSDGHIFDAITVLTMFLQQVYPPDTAGQYWYRWPIVEQEYSFHNPDDPEARVFEQCEEEEYEEEAA